MAAALKALLAVAHWRWTPFFGLLGGALLYVGIVLLVVPTKIKGPSPRTKESLVVLTDESSPLSANVGRDPRAARSPSMPVQPAAPISPSEPSPRIEPPPPPVMVPQPREVEPRPQPEPPQPPPLAPAPPAQPDEEDAEDEEDEEDEQGAAPPPPRNRALAGALRMLPRAIQSNDEE